MLGKIKDSPLKEDYPLFCWNCYNDKAMLEKTPLVSIAMATLDAAKVLPLCLEALKAQDYPQDRIELVVGDGGSTDATIELVKKYGARVYHNPLKTGEAGKAVALKQTRGELVVLLDSDDIMPDSTWLRRMVEPLISDPELIGSEPLHYTYRKQDGFIDRYCALLGMNDPLCLWIGNYDRMCTLTGKWTELPVKAVDRGDYLELTLESGKLPTIGANGAMFRRDALMRALVSEDYLFDVDIIENLISKEGPKKAAKVKVGITHLFCGSDLKKFARKQRRRIKDVLHRRSVGDIFISQNYGDRKYRWGGDSIRSFAISIFIKFILSCLLVFPLVYQSIKGYLRKRDGAWFAHPILCWITLVMYGWGTLESFVSRKELSREGWGQ